MTEEEIENTSRVIVEKDLTGELLWLTMGKYLLFMSYSKIGIDAMALYIHYMFTAKMQETNSVKAFSGYCREGLGWGKDRFNAAKKLLIDLEIIEDVVRRDEKKRITGYFVKVKARKSPFEPAEIVQLLENLPVDFPAGGETALNALTKNLNALTKNIKHGDTSEIPQCHGVPEKDSLSKQPEPIPHTPSCSAPLSPEKVLREINRRNQSDVERPRIEGVSGSIPGGVERVSVDPEQPGGHRRKTPEEKKISDEMMEDYKTIRDILYKGYRQQNGMDFNPKANGKSITELTKLFHGKMDKFRECAQEFYRGTTVKDDLYKNYTFSPNHFLWALDKIMSRVGGMTQEERDKYRFSSGEDKGKIYNEKMRLEV